MNAPTGTEWCVLMVEQGLQGRGDAPYTSPEHWNWTRTTWTLAVAQAKARTK